MQYVCWIFYKCKMNKTFNRENEILVEAIAERQSWEPESQPSH